MLNDVYKTTDGNHNNTVCTSLHTKSFPFEINNKNHRLTDFLHHDEVMFGIKAKVNVNILNKLCINPARTLQALSLLQLLA